MAISNFTYFLNSWPSYLIFELEKLEADVEN